MTKMSMLRRYQTCPYHESVRYGLLCDERRARRGWYAREHVERVKMLIVASEL